MPNDWSFSPHQRATIEAAMARIIPTDETPGAREAGAIHFLEGYLSGLDRIYAKPDGSGFEVLEGRQAEAWRRRIEIMRARYVEGVRELDARAHRLAARDFVSLEPQQQDEVLRGLEQARSEGPALQQTATEVDLDFFPLLVAHTRQGFLADPIYGGNEGRIGWQAIGFPGPASLAEVHSGRYTTLTYFAEGEAENLREFHHGL